MFILFSVMRKEGIFKPFMLKKKKQNKKSSNYVINHVQIKFNKYISRNINLTVSFIIIDRLLYTIMFVSVN